MAAIFAIIAIFGQAIFAIVAISFFAFFANTSEMSNLREQQARWLAAELEAAGRGARSALARELKLGPDAVTRMTNLKPGKEAREISVSELQVMAKFFKSDPPGLSAAKHAPEPTNRASPRVALVPLIDSVTAGKLREPTSQIPVERVPLLAFADLGRGDFFALTVEGDSMDRLSPEGSVIVVNKADRQLVNGRCYVFSHRGETTFKMWKGADPMHLAPYSTNPANQPIFVKKKRDLEVIGRVKRTVLDL